MLTAALTIMHWFHKTLRKKLLYKVKLEYVSKWSFKISQNDIELLGFIISTELWFQYDINFQHFVLLRTNPNLCLNQNITIAIHVH